MHEAMAAFLWEVSVAVRTPLSLAKIMPATTGQAPMTVYNIRTRRDLPPVRWGWQSFSDASADGVCKPYALTRVGRSLRYRYPFDGAAVNEIGIGMTTGTVRSDVARLVVGRRIGSAAAGLIADSGVPAVGQKSRKFFKVDLWVTVHGLGDADCGVAGRCRDYGILFPAWRAARLDTTVPLRQE